jgi:toxin ParE1/3/4
VWYVAEFRISPLARSQLLDIYNFTVRRFDVEQAEAYYAGCERRFELIADFPKMGVAADELVTGLHRFRFQSHVIFYSVEEPDVLIRALAHTSQQVRPEMFK